MKNNLFFSSPEPMEDSDDFFEEKQRKKLAEIGAKIRESRKKKSLGLEELTVMTGTRV